MTGPPRAQTLIERKQYLHQSLHSLGVNKDVVLVVVAAVVVVVVIVLVVMLVP